MSTTSPIWCSKTGDLGHKLHVTSQRGRDIHTIFIPCDTREQLLALNVGGANQCRLCYGKGAELTIMVHEVTIAATFLDNGSSRYTPLFFCFLTRITPPSARALKPALLLHDSGCISVDYSECFFLRIVWQASIEKHAPWVFV